MGETTKIEWADATFNPWIGCTRVSPGCANCYAEALMDKRWGKVKWGKGQPRQRTSDANWRQPLAWNRKAEKAAKIARVFCASLADWLDPEVDPGWVADLLSLIARTPALTWMLLTKRPQLWRERLDAVMDLSPASLVDAQGYLRITRAWLDGLPPANVWLGTTVEDQQRADERIPALLAIPARVRFLSCEPLLGPVDLVVGKAGRGDDIDALTGSVTRYHGYKPRDGSECGINVETACHADAPRIHWIITGGESGTGARPSHPEWFRSLRDQAQATGVAFHFKQWGEWQPAADIDICNPIMATPVTSERYHALAGGGGMLRVGKGAAGRELDGRTWDELPRAR